MANKELFLNIASHIKREGIDEFMIWLLQETDFCEAPASTKYHGAYEGGLLDHSLKVYDNLRTNVLTKDLKCLSQEYDGNTLAIVSLFHDVCKANFYEKSTRNVKNKTTNKWEAQPCYIINELTPFGGHGSKSVYLLMKHGLKLTEEEAIAINCHMGGWDVTQYHSPSGAFEKYPLALYLHIADMLATYIDKC